MVWSLWLYGKMVKVFLVLVMVQTKSRFMQVYLVIPQKW